MLFSVWCTRRVGGLSLISLVALCAWVLSSEVSHTHDVSKPEIFHPFRNIGRKVWIQSSFTLLFAYYSIFIHILVTIFPFRACYAIWEVTQNLKKVSRTKKTLRKRTTFFESHRKLSSTSLLSEDTLVASGESSPSSACSDVEDIESGYHADIELDIPRNIHTILIPNYKEDMYVLRETLGVLACHPQARSQYSVILAMEARETNCSSKAMDLILEFGKSFRDIDFTIHPGDIEGESAGKSSNISWAARKASEKYTSRMRNRVIFTVIDADSHLSSTYFTLLTELHWAYPTTAVTTLYSAPIIFDRNSHLVPTLVRVADVLWGAAGISGLYRSSTIGPPTSVYSLPLTLADKVGGWDTDRDAIGEDLHMYLKCFFALNGNLTTRTILAPVSQTNVSSGLKGSTGLIQDFKARYKQALRHMWGALDSGFALRSLFTVWRERNCTRRTFRPLHANRDNSYIPAEDLENALKSTPTPGAFSDVMHHDLQSPDWIRIISLFHRLFEAHFLPIHMAILVVSSSICVLISPSAPSNLNLAWAFRVAEILRVVGFLAVGLYMALYESYHSHCVTVRKGEMKQAGLYEGMEGSFSTRSWRTNIQDYFVIPLVAPMFGSIPASQAQISHFWTLDLVYAVSKKPERHIMVKEKDEKEVDLGLA